VTVVGFVILMFIVNFDIPVEGRASGFLFLTPLGGGIIFYGLIVLWRERLKKKP